LTKLRVLLVEDNILHMTLVKEQLIVSMGILHANISCAFDGEDAIKMIEYNILEKK
jgi:CheY-like chemotaxis protein